MKLITEENRNVNYIFESDESGLKNLWIQGPFIQSNIKNKNGRIYEKHILEPVIDRFINEMVKEGRAVGELNHPDTPRINPERVSHRITQLEWDGDTTVGKALVLNTPMGKVVKGLVEGGVKMGVSTRGMGTLDKKENADYVRDDFVLVTVDVVHDPSAPGAFVNGILEGKEWIMKGGLISEQEIESIETEVKQLYNKKQLAEMQLKMFANFLSKL